MKYLSWLLLPLLKCYSHALIHNTPNCQVCQIHSTCVHTWFSSGTKALQASGATISRYTWKLHHHVKKEPQQAFALLRWCISLPTCASCAASWLSSALSCNLHPDKAVPFGKPTDSPFDYLEVRGCPGCNLETAVLNLKTNPETYPCFAIAAEHLDEDVLGFVRRAFYLLFSAPVRSGCGV